MTLFGLLFGVFLGVLFFDFDIKKLRTSAPILRSSSDPQVPDSLKVKVLSAICNPPI
jgi:hypothetical protein